MANIRLEATPSDDLEQYTLALDDPGNEVDMSPDNTGLGPVEGTCGDGSEHRLYYALRQTVGAKLSVVGYCDDGSEVLNCEIEIYPPGPVETGWVDFVL
jgi:hypothetical protein